MVQLSHSYMTTGKTAALTRQTFVSKVMCLLFNMLSMFVISFLPRRKCLLILWLQSPSALIYEPPKIKSVTIPIVSPSLCHEVVGPDAMISGSPCPCTLTISTLSCVCFCPRLAAPLSALPFLPSVPLKSLLRHYLQKSHPWHLLSTFFFKLWYLVLSRKLRNNYWI